MKNSQELSLILNLNLLTLVGLIGVFVFANIIYSFRFRIILKKCSGRSVPFFAWFKIVVLSRFLSTFAPQAGNVYRVVVLKQNYQITYTRYAGSFFSFTWIDTAINMFFTIVLVLVVQPDMRIGSLPAWHLLTGLLVLIVVVPILLEAVFRLFNFRNRHIAWLHGRISELLTVSVRSLTDGPYMLKITLTGIISFINSLAAFYLCFASLDLRIDLPSLALFYVVLKLSNHVIITPGNLGVREIAYGIMSEQLQIGMAQGILISVIIRVIGTLVIMAMGTIFGGFDLLRRRVRE